MKSKQTTVRCTGCREDQLDLLLHHVRQRGSLHRLCSSCVLKFHPETFCPVCLELFDGSLLSGSYKCSKCTATAHSACVCLEAANKYVCPSCSNPSHSFGLCERTKRNDDESGEWKLEFDLKSAKVLLAAARISALSMSKAANSARLDAERKVREAAAARRRAREALETAASVASKLKERNDENKAKGDASNAIVVAETKTSPKMNCASGVASLAGVSQKRVQGHKFSGPVAAPLSSSGRREKEKLGGFQATAVLIQRMPKKSVGAEEKEKLMESPSSVLCRLPLQNHAGDEEKERNKAVPGSSVSGQQQSQNISCSFEEDDGEEGKAKRLPESGSSPQKLPLPNQG